MFCTLTQDYFPDTKENFITYHLPRYHLYWLKLRGSPYVKAKFPYIFKECHLAPISVRSLLYLPKSKSFKSLEEDNLSIIHTYHFTSLTHLSYILLRIQNEIASRIFPDNIDVVNIQSSHPKYKHRLTPSSDITPRKFGK